MVKWTETQERRLGELNAGDESIQRVFDTTKERDRAFQQLEKQLKTEARHRLEALRTGHRRPGLERLQEKLVGALTAADFVQVTTPIIMSRAHLAKMGVDATHDLNAQVFWLDKKRCLRPMLAPHLYYVLKDLLRLWEKPVRIFEVGPCFRKETQGAQHANEFTMLNLVEMGLPKANRTDRLKELAALVMETAGISDYEREVESSAVYGDTLDIVAGKDRLEVASGAMGPHILDEAWQITDTWVGIGFGLERLMMISQGSDSLGKMGRSLSYLDGIRLNV